METYEKFHTKKKIIILLILNDQFKLFESLYKDVNFLFHFDFIQLFNKTVLDNRSV